MAKSGCNENVDIEWEYGKRIGTSKQQIRRKFCRKDLSGGITRFKQHLAHRGKSPIIEEEEEEEEKEDEEEEDEDAPRMDSIERGSPWPSGYLNVYLETEYSQYPPQLQPVSLGAGSFSYFFGYPPQYGYGYGYGYGQTNYNNNNNDDDDNSR